MTFLRPWLLVLILVPFLFNKTLSYVQHKTAWKNIVDDRLLPYLLVSGNKSSFGHVWSKLIVILWMLFSVAVAGPAIENIQLPASQDLENTVIILDLGPTMTPEMLNIAHTKLYDLIHALVGNRVGLVLYADKGYTAVPLTGDRVMIKNLIPSLNASVLPNTHNNPKAGFAQAESLIKQAGDRGRILYITAGGVNVQGISSPHPIGVLYVGNAENISPALAELGKIQSRTIDDSDIHHLLSATHEKSVSEFKTLDMAEYAFDLGGIICLILLPFFAWTFRKGFLFILILGMCIQVKAGFFKRSDQELFMLEQQAVQAYRSGQYESSLGGFAHSPYNQGNALAYMGKIPEAIQSYALALQLDPNDADAKFNKEYLEKELQKQQQQQEQNQQDSQDSTQQENQSDDKQNSSNDIQKNDTSSQNEEQQQSVSQQEQSSDQDDRSEENMSNQSQTDEQDESEQLTPTPLEIAEEESPFNQQEQQILNRLNKDPSQVLRYRIYKQHMQRR